MTWAIVAWCALVVAWGAVETAASLAIGETECKLVRAEPANVPVEIVDEKGQHYESHAEAVRACEGEEFTATGLVLFLGVGCVGLVPLVLIWRRTRPNKGALPATAPSAHT